MQTRKIQKQIHQYTAVFAPDMKDGGYTVTIPALPGCISEGDTFEAAMANIKEAAVLYVEVMKERHVKDFFEQKAHVIIAPLELAI